MRRAKEVHKVAEAALSPEVIRDPAQGFSQISLTRVPGTAQSTPGPAHRTSLCVSQAPPRSSHLGPTQGHLSRLFSFILQSLAQGSPVLWVSVGNSRAARLPCCSEDFLFSVLFQGFTSSAELIAKSTV